MNPFENKAIKFETEQELNHLAELAKSYGLKVDNLEFADIRCRYFRVNNLQYYTNCFNNMPELPEITYSDFIASLEDKPIHFEQQPEIDYKKSVKNIYPDAVLDVDSDRDGCNSYRVLFKDKDTPFFPSSNQAWKSAYQMLPPTPNHTEQPDMVNHPPHYNVDGYEVIDIIKAFGLNFPMGSALKYLLRAERKGKKIEDLKKAIWCIQYEVEQSEKQK